MITRTILLGAMLSALMLQTPLTAFAQPAAAAAMLPASAFFDDFEAGSTRQARLSPDGKHTAYLTPGKSGRFGLVIIDNASKERSMIKQYGDADIDNLHWINSKRLAYSVYDRSDSGRQFNPGLIAINLDGSEEKHIAGHMWQGDSYENGSSRFKTRTLDPNSNLAAVIAERESDDLYVFTFQWGQGVDRDDRMILSRVNSKTLSKETLSHPGRIHNWLLGHDSEIRLLTGEEDGQFLMHYRAPGSQGWQVIWRQPSATNSMLPLGFDAEGKLYVSYASAEGRNQVYRFDPVAKKVIEPPLLSLKDNDFHGKLLFIKGKLAGAHFETDGRDSIWFDPALRTSQQKVDAQLKGGNNLLYPAPAGSQYILVRASSDTSPLKWFLYDQSNDKLEFIGSALPQIKANQMAQKDFVRFNARDGLSIPMYITLPKDSPGKNLPLVLMVHGGPHVRGASWEWDPHSQFLASRGYAVAEPLFRGSDGFGAKHMQAGFKQWGLKMQDDLVDSVQWLVKQGIADPKRICIAGASYGGYATMMGLLRDPELFRCGVSWVGVSDIELLFDARWIDWTDNIHSHYAPVTIGDPKTEAERLRATSPLTHAAKLKKPLLLAYGALDRRVSIKHGRKFYDAAKSAGAPVEWIEYSNEGHGWRSVDNNVDFWEKTEKFLNKHIGAQAQ